MWDTIKGLFLIIIGIICIYIPASCVVGCVKNCNEKNEIIESNTQIQLLVDGPEKGDQEWSDGRVTSYASVGFKNTGKEVVYRVSCNVNFYDSKGFLLGTCNFNYDPADKEPVEYGQSTARYVFHVTSKEGYVATRITITDLKVNGFNKPSGYN